MRLVRRLSAYWLAVIWLAGCSLAPVKKSSTERAFFSHRLILASNLGLELEPCGCSVHPRGGVERIATALRRERANHPDHFAFLISGASFVLPEGAASQEGKYLQEKSAHLVQALNLLGAKAYAPSHADMYLGQTVLRKLAGESQFPWLSTNLVDKEKKLVFASHTYWQTGSTSILIVGFTSPQPRKVKSDLTVLPVATAVARVLPLLASEQKPDLTVVLGDLTFPDRELLASRLSGPLVFAGTEPANNGHYVVQTSHRELEVGPLVRGQGLAALGFDLRGGVQSLWNPAQYRQVQDSASYWRHQKYLAEKQGKQTPELEQALAKVAEFPASEGPSTLRYEAQLYELDKSFAETNELSALVAAWKESRRTAALEE